MGNTAPQNVSDHLDTEAAARHLDLAPSTLHKYRSLGGGPKFKKFGRTVRYTLKDLDEWSRSRTCESTFDPTYLSLQRRK